MESTIKKLWNRNFSLVTLCHAVAMLGNMALSAALAFYVRDITGSESMFGLALSAPYISMLMMSPLGGIMADRLKKQRIMLWIDISVVVIILLFLAANGLFSAALPLAFVKLLALNAVQGVYMSTTAAAVPTVVPTEKLQPANALITVINALIGASGQALAAVLYGNFGLLPILIPFAILYGFVAIMDLFIRIPYKIQKSNLSVTQIIKSDMSQAIKFVSKDKPILIKLAVISFFVFATIVSLLVIGLPILITDTLNMNLSMVGIGQMSMAIGGLVGGITAGALGARLTISRVSKLLMVYSFLPIPVGLLILFNAPAIVIFVALTVICVLVMFVLTLIVITAITYVQIETTQELLGKVLALFSMLPFLAQAVGAFAFGVLFDIVSSSPYIVVFAATLISTIVAIYAHKSLRNMPPCLSRKNLVTEKTVNIQQQKT